MMTKINFLTLYLKRANRIVSETGSHSIRLVELSLLLKIKTTTYHLLRLYAGVKKEFPSRELVSTNASEVQFVFVELSSKFLELT